MNLTRSVLLLLGMLVVSGCGGDGDTDPMNSDVGSADTGVSDLDSSFPTVDANDDENVGESYRVAMTVAEGGVIGSDSNGATLEIPRRALESDVEITLDVLTATAETASSIYEFGPDGTFFQTPARLSIEVTAEVPEGMRAVIAYRQGDEDWTPIASTNTDDGRVEADVRHFTRFAVVLVPYQPADGAMTLVGFKNVAAIAEDSTPMNLFIDYGAGAAPTVVGATGPHLAFDPFAYVDAPSAPEVRLFVAADASGRVEWEATGIELPDNHVVHVIYRMQDPDDQSKTAEIYVDSLTDLAAYPVTALRVRAIGDGPDVSELLLWDRSVTPPVPDSPLALNVNYTWQSPPSELHWGFGVAELGHTEPVWCLDVDLEANDIGTRPNASVRNEPIAWLFFGSAPERVTASDSMAQIDFGNGTVVEFDTDICP